MIHALPTPKIRQIDVPCLHPLETIQLVLEEPARLPLDTILGQADFVSLHLPLTPETKNMVNEKFVSKMKRGSYLINTARGELIDENALYAALKDGYLAGAGLDALSKEPPEPGMPLLALPNVVSTPHLGSQSDGAVRRMGVMAFDDCIAVLKGLPPSHPVN